MPVDYTTTSLIASVKRRCLTPDSQNTYMDADILALATEELHDMIVPIIMDAHEEYFVYNIDTSVVSGQRDYPIPDRSMFTKLRDVVLVDANGTELDVPRLTPEFVAGISPFPRLTAAGIVLRDDKVVIPTGNILMPTIRMKIFRRPNHLVSTSEAGRVSVIDTVLKQVTLESAPTSWTTSTKFDFIKGKSPFRSLGDSKTITAISTTLLTFTDTLPTDLAVGDYVAEEYTSPVAQVPYEAHAVLAQRVAVKMLEGLGDTEGMLNAVSKYDDMVERLKNSLNPRVDGALQKVNSRSGLFSYLRNYRRYRYT